MVFKKLLSGKKKLLYSDLTILNDSSDAIEWFEKMKNYFIILGYKDHLEKGKKDQNTTEWKIDEKFMLKILKDHLKLGYHKYVESDLSIYNIMKNLEHQLIEKNSFHNSKLDTTYLYDYNSFYLRSDHELIYNFDKVYFNLLVAS